MSRTEQSSHKVLIQKLLVSIHYLTLFKDELQLVERTPSILGGEFSAQSVQSELGEMAIVGPRPALWNQFDLIAERDKYRANDIRPGLTGWAQINGRDELEIEDKSRLDGYYVDNMSFLLDLKCFFGTFLSVLRSDGVVEGGTGQKKEK